MLHGLTRSHHLSPASDHLIHNRLRRSRSYIHWKKTFENILIGNSSCICIGISTIEIYETSKQSSSALLYMYIVC